MVQRKMIKISLLFINNYSGVYLVFFLLFMSVQVAQRTMHLLLTAATRVRSTWSTVVVCEFKGMFVARLNTCTWVWSWYSGFLLYIWPPRTYIRANDRLIEVVINKVQVIFFNYYSLLTIDMKQIYWVLIHPITKK